MDQVDGDYLGSYRRFLVDFVERMNPDDQLPVKMTGHNIREAEVVGEVIDMTLQYLNQKYCPPSLQSHIVHLVIEEIKIMCRKQPEACGLRPQEKTYAPLKLMQAVTGKVNEICQRYLDNSRLALLPPPPAVPLPLATVYAIRNSRRKMEDRHVILHDLNSIFNINDDTTSSYYAVFDGHVGPEAAIYCAAHLHQYLVESVHYPTDPENALRDAFITTDAHFVQKSQENRINSGATAVCALIINKKLYVAWAGDSQAAIAKRGNATQLVNPHRPDRIDEKERVKRMGGSVIYFGMWRVNGHLAVSRAIGDAQYKPFVTSDPEIRCVILDGTEDFLIIACDGLWDHIDETTAAGIVYQQVCHNPHNLETVSQRLVEYSKNKGSSDNITVIVVFLTPPSQIATRFSHNHPLIADVKLNNMEPDNRYFSTATGQYDVNAGINASFVKQLRTNQNNGTGFDDDELFNYNKSSNGKHENGAVDYEEDEEGEEDDDDDLGPESNVDAVDDVAELSIDSVSRELFPEKIPREQLSGVTESSSALENTNLKKNEVTVDAENVGDSEDSDDEWNYYKVDPDKEKETIDKTEKTDAVEEDLISNEIYDNDIIDSSFVVIKSEKEREREIEEKEKETSNSSSDSEEDSKREVPTDRHLLTELEIREKSETDNLAESPEDLHNPEVLEEEMDFQLNPNAAEFIPVSPAPGIPSRILDIPISGSPLKHNQMMDDLRVPSPSEFQKEVSHRPSEIEEKITLSSANGDVIEKTEDINDIIDKKPAFCLDESEVSSTRAEFGDESTVSYLTTNDLTRTAGFDGSFTTSYDGDDNDPMTMSFHQDDFNPLSTNQVDLNAVHELNDADLTDGNNGNDDEKDNCTELHPELADLISPDTEQPKPSDAFPDNKVNEMFDNDSSIEKEIEDRIEKVSQQVEAMNLKNVANEISDENPFELENLDYQEKPENSQPLRMEDSEQEHAIPQNSSQTKEPFDLMSCDSIGDAPVVSSPIEKEEEMDIPNVFPVISSPIEKEEELSVHSEVAVASSPFEKEEELSVNSEVPIASSPFEKEEKLDVPSEIPVISSPFEKEEELSVHSEVAVVSSPFEKEEELSAHSEIAVVSSPFEKEEELSAHSEIAVVSSPFEKEEELSTHCGIAVVSSPFEKEEEFSVNSDIPVASAPFEKEDDSDLPSEVPVFSSPVEKEEELNIPTEIPVVSSPMEEEETNIPRELPVVSSPFEKVGESNYTNVPNEFVFGSSIDRMNEHLAEVTSSNPFISNEAISPLPETIKESVSFEEDKQENLINMVEEIPSEKPLIEQIIEPCASIKLSESLQEFTGLEQQFNPLENNVSTESHVNEAILQPELISIPSSNEPTVEPVAEYKPEPSIEASLEPKVEIFEEKLEPIVAPLTAPIIESIPPPAVVESEKEKSPVKSKTSVKPPPSKSTLKPTKIEVKSSLKPAPTSPNKTASPRAAGLPAAKKPSPRPKTAATATTTATKTAPVGSKPPTKPPAPRLASAPPKPKAPIGTSRLSATKPSGVEKRAPALNGEVKTTNAKPKVTNTKPLVKPPVTASRTTSAVSKPKAPLPSTKTSSTTTATGTAATKTQRPKTAPPTGTSGTLAAKTRMNLAPKSPSLDKQIKETANKQISSSRTSTTATSTVKKSTTLTTTSTVSGAKRVSSTTVGVKKTATSTRIGAKSSTANAKKEVKTTTTTKAKLSNGVNGTKETVVETIKNDEDVPQKDASPVEPSNDNQLIITAE